MTGAARGMAGDKVSPWVPHVAFRTDGTMFSQSHCLLPSRGESAVGYIHKTYRFWSRTFCAPTRGRSKMLYMVIFFLVVPLHLAWSDFRIHPRAGFRSSLKVMTGMGMMKCPCVIMASGA